MMSSPPLWQTGSNIGFPLLYSRNLNETRYRIDFLNVAINFHVYLSKDTYHERFLFRAIHEQY